MEVPARDGRGRRGLPCRGCPGSQAARAGGKKTAPGRMRLVLPAPGWGDAGGVCHGAPQGSFQLGARWWGGLRGKDNRLCALAVVRSLSGSSRPATPGLCPPASLSWAFCHSKKTDRDWKPRTGHQGREGPTAHHLGLRNTEDGGSRASGPELVSARSCRRDDRAESRELRRWANEQRASARQTGPSPLEAEGPETASWAKTSFHKLPCSSSSLYKLFILPKATLLTVLCLSEILPSLSCLLMSSSPPTSFFCLELSVLISQQSFFPVRRC